MTNRSLLAACLCSVLALACSEDDDYQDNGVRPPPPPATTGTLVMSWSIEGRQDAAACQEIGAVAFQTSVYDQGFGIGTWRIPCEDFETSIDLYVDDFFARSTLLDINESAVIRRIVEDAFVIADGQVTRLAIDFPLPSSPMPPADTPDAGAAPALDAGALPASEADAGADAI